MNWKVDERWGEGEISAWALLTGNSAIHWSVRCLDLAGQRAGTVHKPTRSPTVGSRPRNCNG